MMMMIMIGQTKNYYLQVTYNNYTGEFRDFCLAKDIKELTKLYKANAIQRYKEKQSLKTPENKEKNDITVIFYQLYKI